MTLNDLNEDERIALVGLIELVVGMTGDVSDEELERIESVSGELGDDLYRQAAELVDERFHDEEQFRKFLGTIQRPEARELIYETALEASIPDAIGPRESEVLDWLARAWDLSVRAVDAE